MKPETVVQRSLGTTYMCLRIPPGAAEGKLCVSGKLQVHVSVSGTGRTAKAETGN
jgi:hypothetical protein